MFNINSDYFIQLLVSQKVKEDDLSSINKMYYNLYLFLYLCAKVLNAFFAQYLNINF